MAKRIPPRTLPPPTTELQKQGLRYERRVLKALLARGFHVEHNPWFEYWGGVCCPDIVIYELAAKRAIVVEVKHSSTVQALAKLRNIYCPVIALATGLQTLPLVITKNINRMKFEDLYFNHTLDEAIESSSPVYFWPSKGPIT